MSWFKKPVNVGITVGAAVLLVAVIVFLIIGIMAHEEAGLLEVCWKDGKALYVDASQLESGEVVNGSCERPEELSWSKEQIPLSVAAVTPDKTEIAPGEPEREGLDAAIQDINRQLRFTLFTATTNRAGADVVAELGRAVDIVQGGVGEGKRGKKVLGDVQHYRATVSKSSVAGDNGSGKNNFKLLCTFWIYESNVDLRVDYLVAHHELLHCAGLAHDNDDPSSAIYPFTYDDTMWIRMKAARITDHDRNLLRVLYFKE